MSRQGDPLDWDYGEDAADVGRAVAGTVSQAGIVGQPITAMIPHADQCVIIGCASTMWIMRGDPAYGGQIDNISRRIGVVDKRAWCYVPSTGSGDEGLIVFLSFDGLYMIPAGCQVSAPVSLSREKLPEELLDVDRNLTEVSLSYDVRDRGIHVYVTKIDSGNTTHWWYDWETRGFFPVSVTTSYEPMYTYEYVSTCSEDSCVLLGGRDGKIRRYHALHDKDDGNNAITSYVDIGPLLLGNGTFEQGVIAEVQGDLAVGTANVTAAFRGGHSPEDAFNSSALYSTTWKQDGLQYCIHPRVVGQAGFVKLTNAESLPWGMERILIRVQPMGSNKR
jgi:hypothetical protein